MRFGSDSPVRSESACAHPGRRLPRLGAALLITLLLTVAWAGPASSAARFTDVPSTHPYATAIDDLAGRGMVSGFGDGSFRPGASVTRMQFAKMIDLAMGFTVTEQDSSDFRDVPHGSGLYPYHFVSAAANNGLMLGYDEDVFGPFDQIIRQQLITTIARAAGSSLAQPPDDWQGVVDSSDPTHGENLRWAEYSGLLAGIEDLAQWDPSKSATRGEVAQVLYNLLVKTAYRPPLSVSNYGAKGDGVSDDSRAIQKAIDARPTGGLVTIPAGTYAVDTDVDLKSGVTFQGAGVGQTTLSMPGRSQPTDLLAVRDVSGASISDMTLSSPAASGDVFAISLSRYADCSIERVNVTGCQYALKADTRGSGLTVRDFNARACGQVYISNLTGGLFENLDLSMVTQKLTDVTFHAIYLCDNNHDLEFDNVKARGGSGWTVQLWSDEGWSDRSDNIVFDHLDTADLPLLIGVGFDGVSIKNLAATSTRPDEPCVRLYSSRNIVIEGFAASGGSAFLGQGYEGAPDRVTLRNGVYAGDTLVSGGGTWITDLLTENVSLALPGVPGS